jgi:hypothetical protein
VERPPASTRSEQLKTAGAAALLMVLNALVTARLFRIEYTTQMGSIEAAFISLARYIRDHFPHLNWFPLWYGGVPYPDTYPPLLLSVVALVSGAAHVSPGLAYHAVVAWIYAFGPVVLFWAAWRMGATRAAAFAAALMYSVISPSVWLVREVRFDSGGWLGPRRLVTLVQYGEGPHLLSLLLLPAAAVLLHRAIERRTPPRIVAAGLLFAAVALTNWIGGFALAVLVAAYLLARFDRSWIVAAGIGLFAWALAMPWTSPSTIATIRANAPLVGGKFEPGPAYRLVVAGIALAALGAAWALKRWGVPLRARFGVLFLAATGALALGAYWFKFSLLPQPQRYHLEMDLAFWMAAALCVPLRPRWSRAVVAASLVVCLPIFVHQRRMARELERPIDIGSTVEYRISRWLGEHMPGQRVFAPGTINFWMDAFSDTPMLPGGFDNGMRNTRLQDVIFQIYFGDRQSVALDWLKAFGCDAVVGGGPRSRELYHPYNHPEKFEGLSELWREGGDVIYAVPRQRSLAHIVAAEDLPPKTVGYDTAPLARYLAAIESPHATVPFRWTSENRAVIQADLRPEQLLSVQVTWDRGWQARVDGQSRRTREDKLGQIVVEPRCSGSCTVELYWDGGLEMQAAWVISACALAGGLTWMGLWRRRSVSTTTN